MRIIIEHTSDESWVLQGRAARDALMRDRIGIGETKFYEYEDGSIIEVRRNVDSIRAYKPIAPADVGLDANDEIDEAVLARLGIER